MMFGLQLRTKTEMQRDVHRNAVRIEGEEHEKFIGHVRLVFSQSNLKHS